LLGYKADVGAAAALNRVAIGYKASSPQDNFCQIGGPGTDGVDVGINSDRAYYIGDPTTDGSWRIVRSGNDLQFQRREGGTWVNKGAILA
jgi:hypothetical protein